ncbi:hypothetical protein THAOC_09847 [Thalassiosira oceanica]|uniref:Uncharacterized protein n=1 Tax=Thalassiosira oceanica TaxID=159749 RepID=K0SRM1_THAOC|nr:hypothetical protein THAOC_09847 [Thalassiosira oceanica]|eukprot:EJK68948.1 hypothetical protein THAOC_09847 [Thalassiosira oceanica]
MGWLLRRQIPEPAVSHKLQRRLLLSYKLQHKTVFQPNRVGGFCVSAVSAGRDLHFRGIKVSRIVDSNGKKANEQRVPQSTFDQFCEPEGDAQARSLGPTSSLLFQVPRNYSGLSIAGYITLHWLRPTCGEMLDVTSS